MPGVQPAEQPAVQPVGQPQLGSGRYMRIIEKSVIPGDAGVILCWTAERGVAPYDVGLTHLEEYRAKLLMNSNSPPKMMN